MPKDRKPAKQPPPPPTPDPQSGLHGLRILVVRASEVSIDGNRTPPMLSLPGGSVQVLADGREGRAGRCPNLFTPESASAVAATLRRLADWVEGRKEM